VPQCRDVVSEPNLRKRQINRLLLRSETEQPVHVPSQQSTLRIPNVILLSHSVAEDHFVGFQSVNFFQPHGTALVERLSRGHSHHHGYAAIQPDNGRGLAFDPRRDERKAS